MRHPTPSQDICGLLEARASSGRRAGQISKAIFATIIATLQRRFTISTFDAEVMFADIMREHEDALFLIMVDKVDLDDAQDAVRSCLGDDGR